MSNGASSVESSTQPTLESARMQYFWTRYKNKGFSEKIIELLLSTVDNNSTRMVSSAICIWEHWCNANNVNPTTCNINCICEFFSNMITQGKSYNTIAGYRSVISEIHTQIDGASIGNHSDIIKAMQAI
ncbi:hypothetical protein C1646_777341 [Rhizophagus diaphanus]|nr:hypothetical protein C1646_777341 [Rhizophagus diaphanus] [Rhizophagus sp. MUCL 43196]